MKTITIASDFSDTPLGRYPEDGMFSGERFRQELLLPALNKEEKIVVNIDGTEGYGSSFLEEAFGGLVRNKYFTVSQLKQKLKIECNDPDYRIYQNLIWKYITEAHPE